MYKSHFWNNELYFSLLIMASLCFDSSCEATWFGALTYGGLPITTSKPPFSKTCGNSFCQSKVWQGR